jgi:DNA-binding transcriptional ArsR family regulator
MDTSKAIEAMSALAQVHRMNIFRLLVKEGPAGQSAGMIASRLQISPSCLSFHIAQLERAGLVSSRRDSRNINYTVDIEGMRALLDFLTEDCCNGQPELCGGLAAVMKCDATTGGFRDG